MLEKFSEFLNEMHLLSYAVLRDGLPYASSAFYAYDEKNIRLIVAGSEKSSHIKAALLHSAVSGTIALDTRIVGRIRGIQFQGEIFRGGEEDIKIYLKKFPYAKILSPEIFKIEISWMKFTDNTLGFGKKLEWIRE